jgi:hypothetical protein
MQAFEALYLSNNNIRFEVLPLDNAIYIWIGVTGMPTFTHLQLDTGSSSGAVLGVTHPLAGRLAKRLGCFVYLSMNLPDDDSLIVQWAEGILCQHIINNRIQV